MSNYSPNPIMEAILKANKLVEAGQLTSAKDILEELVSAGNVRPHILFSLGDICRKISDYDSQAKAKDYLNLAIKLASFEKDIHVLVAANSSIAKIYIQEAFDQFDSLDSKEQEEWGELKALLSFNKRNFFKEEELTRMFFLGDCGMCDAQPYGRPTVVGCKGCANPANPSSFVRSIETREIEGTHFDGKSVLC